MTLAAIIPTKLNINKFEFEEIRIENTNHCGYKCFFCPREELSREKGYMSLASFDLLLSGLGSHNGSVDLHGFGEPLLDKLLPEKIRKAKEKWPAASIRIISTLGLSLKGEYLQKLVSSGLDSIEVSFYGIDSESYKDSHGVNKFDLAKKNIESILTLVKSSNSSLELVIREFPKHDKIKQLDMIYETRNKLDQWFRDIGVVRVSQHVIHNYGGGRDYNKPVTEGVCSVSWGFRKRVLQITWDLDIIPCCFDSNSSVVFGNLKTETIEEIFSSIKYLEFINDHENNSLEKYPVCMKCERCFKP